MSILYQRDNSLHINEKKWKFLEYEQWRREKAQEIRDWVERHRPQFPQHVRRHLRNKTADAVMSHGVQLPDLGEALATAAAYREFQRELATMRALCLKLLEAQRLVAS